MKKLSAGAARRALLERVAGEAGDDWVERLSSELTAEHRAAAGGWPGTVGEARSWSRPYLLRHTTLSSPPLTAEEFELSARMTYAHARRKWLACTNGGQPRKLPGVVGP
jgi:hypothetical protein